MDTDKRNGRGNSEEIYGGIFHLYRRNDICKPGMLQMSLYVVVHIARWGLWEYTWIVICYIGMLFFLLLIGRKNFFEKVTAHFMNICPLDCEGIENSSLPFNERSSSYGSSL